MINFTSMIPFEDQITDNRRIHVEFDFHKATGPEQMELAVFCLEQVRNLIRDSFCVVWGDANRQRNVNQLLEIITKPDVDRSFIFYGDVISEITPNLKAVKRYHKQKIESFKYGYELSKREYSADYWEVFHSIFDGLKHPEDIRNGVLTLLKTEGRYYKQKWFMPDLQGGFNTRVAYDNTWHGNFSLRIPLGCLQNGLDTFLSWAKTVLHRGAEITPRINGRIALEPLITMSERSSYHGHFFGGWSKQIDLEQDKFTSGDGSMFRLDAWEYYLREVTWYNLLTPSQTERLAGRTPLDSLEISKLSNGGSTVTHAKRIDQVSLVDLGEIKRYLYPVLFPGCFNIPYEYLLGDIKCGPMAKPRRGWDAVPVFEKEVIATDEGISFQYQSGWDPLKE